MTSNQPSYDSVLLVSFGGPEGMDDVIPFLENVLRGKNVPRERMLEVAHHYEQFGGVSPINEQNRQLLAAMQAEFERQGIDLPIYWGNRNWHPLLPDTLRHMAADGKQRALAFMTSAFSSYSGCRQYREDIARAQAEVDGPTPQVDKLRVFYNHPGFLEPMADRVREAFAQLPAEGRDEAALVFTAHSIPLSMAEHCQYEQQLKEASRLVAEMVGREKWDLVYQSRSGPPMQPWLEPDVCDFLRGLHEQGCRHVVVVPIGFISDHMEVIFDLDTEAQELCQELGMTMIRAATVGVDPRFVSMIGELVRERIADAPRRALGQCGPNHDVCPEDCCLYPRPTRPGAPAGPPR